MPDIRDTVANAIHIPKFTGDLYYVDAAMTDDSEDGTTPEKAKKTIGAAITACSVGDAITIKAGTYTETGLDLNKNYVELWFEIGAIISPASGNGLVVSGNSCRVKGDVQIKSVADTTGLLLSGNGTIGSDIIILGTSITNGIQVIGDECDLRNIRVAGIKSGGKGADIQGDKTTIRQCGIAGSNIASYGFYVSGSIGLIEDCFTTGHTAGGFHLATGVTNYTVRNSDSGAGDGKWRDIDQVNTWSNFNYNEVKTSLASLDANNETKSYNVAQIYGSVIIKKVHIEVLTQFSSNIRNFFLDIYDGATSVPISANTGLTLDSAPVGSLITRIKDSSQVLDYQSGATCFIAENTNFRDVQTEVICGQKGDDTDTYLRMTYTTTDTPSNGQIRGYIEWEPITDDGFVELL